MQETVKKVTEFEYDDAGRVKKETSTTTVDRTEQPPTE